jgi:hypothetical protein
MTQTETVRQAILEAVTDTAAAGELWSHVYDVICGDVAPAITVWLRFLLRDGLLTAERFYILRDKARVL